MLRRIRPERGMMVSMRIIFVVAAAIRVLLIWGGCFMDSVCELQYTDIDYQVLTDAARHVSQGASPFLRPTYRYSPVLALLLLPNIFLHASFGKIIFCLLDVLTAAIVYKVLRGYGLGTDPCRIGILLWLYNPLPVVISTRGSADSLMTFLVVFCVLLFQAGRPVALGLVYGLAIHLKIYPCIYGASLYFALSSDGDKRWWHLVRPSRNKVLFIASSAVGFLVPTLTSYAIYGEDYLNEALLYHLTRKDVRHNYSPYFYLLYLLDSRDDALASVVSFSSFAVQAALIFFVSWTFTEPRTLPACMFVETLLFVSLNKVCTAQYFMWYVCFFPICYPLFGVKIKLHLLVWAGGQVLWLLPAYWLEFEGRNTFFLVYLSSLLFSVINVYLVCFFVKCLAKTKAIKSD